MFITNSGHDFSEISNVHHGMNYFKTFKETYGYEFFNKQL